MRLITLLAIAAGAAAMSGCGPVLSIHPLYTGRDLVSDLPLEGDWAEEDDGQLWQVRKSGDGYDVVTLSSEDAAKTERYNVHLVGLGEFRFLDITSSGESGTAIPGHLFARVWLEGGELRIALPAGDWWKQMMEDHLAPQAVAGVGQTMILTAPTSELQRFVLLHAAGPGAFDAEPAELRRVR